MHRLALCLVILALASCSHDMGSPSVDITAYGAPTTCYAGNQIQLNGVATGQHGATVYDVRWAQQSGPASVNLLARYDPGVVTGIVPTAGTYVFTYVVRWRDGAGITYNEHTDTKTVTIAVAPAANG
jgi:hypothetical protein